MSSLQALGPPRCHHLASPQHPASAADGVPVSSSFTVRGVFGTKKLAVAIPVLPSERLRAGQAAGPGPAQEAIGQRGGGAPWNTAQASGSEQQRMKRFSREPTDVALVASWRVSGNRPINPAQPAEPHPTCTTTTSIDTPHAVPPNRVSSPPDSCSLVHAGIGTADPARPAIPVFVLAASRRSNLRARRGHGTERGAGKED